MGTVILIAVVIVFLVIPTLKDRTVGITRLFISPIVFMILLYDSLQKNFNLDDKHITVIVISLIIGAVIGALMRIKSQVKADRSQGLISLKGSYFGVIIFSLIFIAHFFAGYLQSVHAVAVRSGSYESMVLVALCTASALTLGQAAMLYFKYLRA